MTKVKYDEYTKKYFISPQTTMVITGHPPCFAMTFPELEEFSELIRQICQDEYSRALQADLDFGGEDCEGGACKI